MKNGKFVISLDFELMWGQWHLNRPETYYKHVRGVRTAVPEMLRLFERYEIHATWGVVGIVALGSKDEVKKYMPSAVPDMKKCFLAKTQLNRMSEREEREDLFFAESLLKKICAVPNQEIATHTFSHYCTGEKGADAATFRADLQAAGKVLCEKYGISPESIIFPRNQCEEKYIETAAAEGLCVYRGPEKSLGYSEKIKITLLKKIFRFFSTYFCFSKTKCYKVSEVYQGGSCNVRASSFFRPYQEKLKFLESRKVRKIKSEMRTAAQDGLVFHLWWHPHNFGVNTEENIAQLEEVLRYYVKLKKEYGFQSVSMGEVGREAARAEKKTKAEKKVRVLHVIHCLENGGAETFIRNMYGAIDREKVQFDFLLRSKKNSEKIVREIQERGGKIYIAPEFPKKFAENYQYTKQLLSQRSYDCIHIHANAMIYVTPLLLANTRVKKVILHSHNTQSNMKKLGNIVHMINRRLFGACAIIRLACGEEAGRWMFGERTFQIVHNSIEPSRYQFDETVRRRKREELHIQEGETVIGHVGRFVEAKNHGFLLRVFQHILTCDKSAKLLLTGAGELEESVRREARTLGIAEKVLFLGERDDVNELMQAMDLFLFPSKFEGLPFVLIEAQAAGLPILASTCVTTAVNITKKIGYLSLEEDESVWAKRALEQLRTAERYSGREAIKESGYDIKTNAGKMEAIYCR